MIIGYTNGYFDILHVGHISTIRNAAALCDRLIVGVISDDECLKNKGYKPIIPLDERIKVVSSLFRVSMVVPVWDDDKYEEWLRYKFRKLFVGGDHFQEPVWQKWEVKLRGHCDITYLPYLKNISDTIIRERIISLYENSHLP